MKRRKNRLLVFFAFVSILLFACQALSSPQSIVETEEPIYPTNTPATELVINDSPMTANTQVTVVPLLSDPLEKQEILVNLYERSNPGVVAIQVLSETGGGLGSGFVIDKEGHIITNYHVIEDVTDLEVDFSSGFKTRGEVIGIDTDSDLAVIKIDAPPEELHPLPLGDSSKIKVGQTVVAIGSPFSFNGTMTTGIISSLGRTLESLHEAPGGLSYFSSGDIIQTDAAINPGNSGGPLLNLEGEVIGVNRAIRTFNFNDENEPINSGIGFAIAIDIVKRVVPLLISTGSYEYPYLGITSLSDISLLQQEALQLPQSFGAYVTDITPGSPADRAGLQGGTIPTDIFNLRAGGDLIVAIDGQPIMTFNDLLSYLIHYKSPGDTVTLTIIREDREIDLDLTLGKRP